MTSTTSTRKAAPFYVFMLAALLAVSGAYQHFVSVTSVSEDDFGLRQALPQISAREAPQPDPPAFVEPEVKAPPVVEETFAQKRARVAPHIALAALASKVSPALIEAIISAESAYNPLAISRTGAVGLMQLMPDTAKRFGVTDRWDPAQNILGGARYLRVLLGKFNNNLKLAIAAYNAGEGAVEKHRNRIPPFAETQKYVPKVLAYYKRYRAET